MQKIKDWFTKEIASSVMRHILTFIGGILLAKGLANHVQIDSIMAAINSPECQGAALAIIAIVKGAMDKKSALVDLHAAAATGQLPPGTSPLPIAQSNALKSPHVAGES